MKILKQHSHNQTVTCLFGDPVGHSVSDVMFQYFAKLTEVENYNHLKFKISKDNREDLKLAMQAVRVFDIAGANITLPYKEDAMKYLDEFDKTVRLTGAVNTIVNRGRKITGYNTDGHGAIMAIETKLKPIESSDKVMILGAGGAARAIIGSLPKVSNIIVLNRVSDSKRSERLRRDFKQHGIEVEIKVLTDRNIISVLKEANVVINTTPVGMFPKNNTSLIRKSHLDNIKRSTVKRICFFDAVFNPFETEFLGLAKQYGARTCPGIYMMIYQGIRAFGLWTGRKVPEGNVEKISKLLQEEIDSKYEK